MHRFFPPVKEVEDIVLKNQPCKRSKACLEILKGTASTYCGCCASFAFARLWFIDEKIANIVKKLQIFKLSTQCTTRSSHRRSVSNKIYYPDWAKQLMLKVF
jgi:hypothetical protein